MGKILSKGTGDFLSTDLRVVEAMPSQFLITAIPSCTQVLLLAGLIQDLTELASGSS